MRTSPATILLLALLAPAAVRADDRAPPPASQPMSAPAVQADTRVAATRMCEAGDATACLLVGEFLLRVAPEQDDLWRSARTYLTMACDGGVAAGCHNLGVLWADGHGGTKDAARARALYKQACSLGHHLGCTNWGVLLANGRGGGADMFKARQVFSRACERGDARGCANLAVMLRDGHGGRQDGRLADEYDHIACRLGFAASCPPPASAPAPGPEPAPPERSPAHTP